jgi:hypothetical protein
MVKAKDLLKKSPDEFEDDPLEKEENPKKRNEEDRVNEAYENISKRLEEIRNGKVSKEEPDSEDKAEEEKKDEDEIEEPESEDPLDQEEDLSEDAIEEENEEEVEKMIESGEDDKIVAEPVGKVLESDDEEDMESFDSAQDHGDKEPKKTFVKEEEDDSMEDEEMEKNPKRPEEKEEAEDSLDDLAEEELEDAPQPSKSFASEARFDDEEFKRGRAGGGAARGEDEDMHIPQVGSKNDQPSIYSKYGRSSAEDTGIYEEDYPSRREPERDIFASKYQGSGSYNNRRSGSKLHLLILVLIGLAVIGGTVYLLKSQFETKPQPTPSPQIADSTPVPTSTPEPIARAEYKVRILNGTETSGLAKTVSEKLQGLGYQIERTGNATNSAFESTVVRAKSGKIEIIDQLIADLAGDYTAASSPASLRDNDGADAEIILGGK